MRRQPARRVRTISFRAARWVTSLTRAPGSLTEEIARMLETEPQNRQPEDPESRDAGQRPAAGQEGSHRRGLLRRGRRGATKPAEPPQFKSGAADDSPGRAQTGRGAAATSQAQGGVPVVPEVPGHEPASEQAGRHSRKPAAGSSQPVPVAAFQAPVLVFQPPEMTGPGESDRAGADAGGDDAEGASTGSRRRRRGGRGRGKSGGEAADAAHHEEHADGDDQDAGRTAGAERRGASQDKADAGRPDGAAVKDAGREPASTDGAEGEAGGSPSRRRRRRRQRNGSVDVGGEVPAPDEPADTVVHIREPRPAGEPDDVRAIKGSTRLEAKRQRRREGRDTGRRRPPIISESEFLARREAVERNMAVRQQGDRTQIAVLEDGVLVEHYVDRATHQSYVGNVYLGKVQNVLPSMEAAFVDIGKGRNAVLYAGEVNFDATGLEGVAKRIESALKSGQSIMVQVTKDPIGHKGA